MKQLQIFSNGSAVFLKKKNILSYLPHTINKIDYKIYKNNNNFYRMFELNKDLKNYRKLYFNNKK